MLAQSHFICSNPTTFKIALNDDLLSGDEISGITRPHIPPPKKYYDYYYYFDVIN